MLQCDLYFTLSVTVAVHLFDSFSLVACNLLACIRIEWSQLQVQSCNVMVFSVAAVNVCWTVSADEEAEAVGLSSMWTSVVNVYVCLLGFIRPSNSRLHPWRHRRYYWRSKSPWYTCYTWVWYSRYDKASV